MTNENETQSLFTVEAVGESTFKQLEPGAYPAVCVAAVVKNFKKYQSEESEPKCVFTFQIADDDDQMHYVRTAPHKLVAHENSGFGKMIASWLKLPAANLVGWDASKLLGKCAQCVVDIETKGDKTYTRIANVLPAKKSQKDGAIADAIPAFIVKDALQYMLAEGITIKAPELEEPSQSQAAPKQAVMADRNNLTVPTKSPAQAALDDEEVPF